MKSKSILPYVTKPGRYVGHEFNSIQKDWDETKVRFALLFPDLYEIGMSHLGLQIIYHILNNETGTLAERCFCPDLDAEEIMVSKKLPLLSLESSKPISSFDIVGITLPFELCYSNIVTILNLAGIPLYSKDRADSDPIILGGGSCSLNPEPVADFFDAILLGDGEDAILDIANVIKKSKANQSTRSDTLNNLSNIDGIYIPSHFLPKYDSANRIEEITPLDCHPEKVARRIKTDLNDISHLCTPIVPNAKTVHDRLGIEIARGCTRGCRFCQAGMIYRPVRERSVDQIMELAGSGIEQSGFEELALLSLSTGDYSCIDSLLPKLMDKFAKDYVSVSMPSMRVGTLSPSVMDQIKRVRKTGFTVAPEAGSERLRQVINKGITEEDLLQTCEDAFSLGWNAIKLYFMIGLPTETLEDVEAISTLTTKTKNRGNIAGNKRKKITTSVGTFVPKPHTPFQWEEQLSLKESRSRIQYLRSKMPKKGVKLKWHDPEMSFLEGVFSRGDRKLAKLIEIAWSLGARLDSWSDHFDLSVWQQAAKQCDINLAEYLRARSHNEMLPWDHLSSGLDTTFLQEELEKSHKTIYTPDCRYHGCQQCGLCDFKTIKPIVQQEVNSQHPDNQDQQPSHSIKPEDSSPQHYKYMVSYSRLGNISYLGHLEVLQLLFRSIRRANIQTHFSQGFNPSPKISFGGALPVGMESKAEFFIMDLPTPLKNIEQTSNLLNKNLPPGLTVTGIELCAGQIPQSVINTYQVQLPRELSADEIKGISSFLATSSYLMSRVRKGKEKKLDIRPLIKDISLMSNNKLQFKILSSVGMPGIKIQELLSSLFHLQKDEILQSGITKISWQPADSS